jgi:hypothetical protein
MWFDITKGQTGILSKTVRGDKSKWNEVRRVVYYIIEQDHSALDKEGPLPLTFSRSHNWLKKPKLPQKLIENQPEKQMLLATGDGNG